MKLWFAWVGHKKDKAGKSHLWGILNKDQGHFSTRYVFWCSIGKRRTDVKLQIWVPDAVSSYNKARQKEDQGETQITQETVENRWPQVMDDIEMQFVMEKLAK